MRKYIVFANDHYNPLGIIRSLGEKKIKVDLVLVNNGVNFIAKSKYLNSVHLVKDDQEGYEYILNTFADKNEPPFIFTADDKKTLLLNEHYNDLKDSFIFFNTGDNHRLGFYMNKLNIGELALKHGLNFLKSWRVKKGEIPQDLEYPILTKTISSTLGAWKNDSYICNSESELRDAYKKIIGDDILLQKYIEKKNEMTFEGFSTDRGKNVFLSIEVDYDYLIQNYYSPYMTVHDIRHINLKEPLYSMFKDIGFEGIFEIEFLIDQNDVLWFGEINFRNSTWSYASTIKGMNLPYLWAKEMLLHEGDLEKNRKAGKDFHAMVELTDFKYRVKSNKKFIFKWLHQYLHSKCKYFTGRHDLKPLLHLIRHRKDKKVA